MNLQDRKVILSDVSMLMIAVFWGSGFGVSSFLLRSMSPMWLLSFRFLLSAAVVLSIFWKRISRLDVKDLFLSCLGGFSLAITFLFQIFGLVFTTPGKQSFIQSINVILVPIMFAILYKRSPGRLSLAGAVVTTAGLLIMAFTPGMSFNLGDTLSLGLAFTVAFHVILVGNFSRRMDPLAYAVVSFVSAAFLTTFVALLFEPFPRLTDLGRDFWMFFLYVSLVVTVVPFLIQPVAQKYSPDTHAAILMSTESLWGYAIAIFMGEEALNFQVLMGGLVIFAGVLVTESELFIMKQAKKRKNKQEQKTAI